MVDDIAEKSYLPYMVNRSLSYFPDTVLAANEMNIASHLDNKLQFQFLISIVRKRKRFSKWAKADIISDLEVVKEYYDYSNDKARHALTLLSEKQIIELREKVSHGGRRK
jgi:hypothetical protein